jgi:hypothetical protein
MSIATLKKKTQAKYNNMSVGLKQFSLNGGYRSQGYVGQTSLSRSLPRTLMRGNVACGYGGCCGTFPIGTIVQSAVVSLNNPNVIKPSVINTDGMIEKRFMWVKRPQPFSSTKANSFNNLNDQGTYIENVTKTTAINYNKCSKIADTKNKANCCPAYNPYFRRVITINTVSDTSIPFSYNDYNLNRNNACTTNDVLHKTTNTQNTPFACN